MRARRMGAAAALAALALAGCGGPAARRLDTDGQIVRGVIEQLAADRKPVCVGRLTYGDPLQVYRSAKRGELELHYDLVWGAPGPFRPPPMPTQDDLEDAVQENRSAGLPDAPHPGPTLPRDLRARVDQVAYALSPAAIPTRATLLGADWVPAGVKLHWWSGADRAAGCRATYVLSSIKRTRDLAFVTVRIDHWATLYALAPAPAPARDRWVTVGQWASWLY